MVASKPTVVFVPGYWHTSEGFGALAALLNKAEYPSLLIDLPSSNTHPSHPDFSQDVSAIRSTITELADSGKDVLVFMHSGGSVCGSEAVRDLGKKEREHDGKQGGVVRLVYAGILLPKAGDNMIDTFQKAVSSPDLDLDFVIDPNQEFHVISEDGTSIITDGDTRFYNDLPREEAKYWASRLVSQSLGVSTSPLTYEAWNHIPSAYILPLQDKSIPLKQVREIVKHAKIELVLEIETGHCPYLSAPQTVARFIREAAGEAI